MRAVVIWEGGVVRFVLWGGREGGVEVGGVGEKGRGRGEEKEGWLVMADGITKKASSRCADCSCNNSLILTTIAHVNNGQLRRLGRVEELGRQLLAAHETNCTDIQAHWRRACCCAQSRTVESGCG